MNTVERQGDTLDVVLIRDGACGVVALYRRVGEAPAGAQPQPQLRLRVGEEVEFVETVWRTALPSPFPPFVDLEMPERFTDRPNAAHGSRYYRYQRVPTQK